MSNPLSEAIAFLAPEPVDPATGQPDAGVTLRNSDRLVNSIDAFTAAYKDLDIVTIETLEALKDNRVETHKIEILIALRREVLASAQNNLTKSKEALKHASLDEIVHSLPVPEGLAEAVRTAERAVVTAQARLDALLEHLTDHKAKGAELKAEASQVLVERGNVLDAEINEEYVALVKKFVSDLTPLVARARANGNDSIQFWLAESHLFIGVRELYGYKKRDQLLPLRHISKNPELMSVVREEASPRQQLEFELRRA